MAYWKKDLSQKISKIDKNLTFLQDSMKCEDIIKKAIIQEKKKKRDV